MTPLKLAPKPQQEHCTPPKDAYSFKRELTHRLDCDGIFNRHENARTD